MPIDQSRRVLRGFGRRLRIGVADSSILRTGGWFSKQLILEVFAVVLDGYEVHGMHVVPYLRDCGMLVKIQEQYWNCSHSRWP